MRALSPWVQTSESMCQARPQKGKKTTAAVWTRIIRGVWQRGLRRPVLRTWRPASALFPQCILEGELEETSKNIHFQDCHDASLRPFMEQKIIHLKKKEKKRRAIVKCTAQNSAKDLPDCKRLLHMQVWHYWQVWRGNRNAEVTALACLQTAEPDSFLQT